MYPTTFLEWVAFASLLGAAVSWILTQWSARTEAAWRRNQELWGIIYNQNGESGYWRQIVAAYELHRFGKSRRYNTLIAKTAIEYYEKSSGGVGCQELTLALHDFCIISYGGYPFGFTNQVLTVTRGLRP